MISRLGFINLILVDLYYLNVSNIYSNINKMGNGFPPASGKIPPTSGYSGWSNYLALNFPCSSLSR